MSVSMTPIQNPTGMKLLLGATPKEVISSKKDMRVGGVLGARQAFNDLQATYKKEQNPMRLEMRGLTMISEEKTPLRNDMLAVLF